MSEPIANVKEVLFEVEDFHVSYGAIRALSGVSLKVCKGEIVCVIGSNGAGKSTLLKIISGIYPPTSGSVTLQGTFLIGCRRNGGRGLNPRFVDTWPAWGIHDPKSSFRLPPIPERWPK